MPEHVTKPEVQSQAPSSDDTLELSSFTQNIAALEGIVSRTEAEIFGPNPNTDRLSIYQSEAQSLLGELQAQQARALTLRGGDDPNVQRLQHLVGVRLLKIAERADEIVRGAQAKLVALDEQRVAMDAAMTATASLAAYDGGEAPPRFRVEESSQQYHTRWDATHPKTVAADPSAETLSSAVGVLTDSTKRLNELIDAHPEIREDALPVLKQLVELSIKAILQRGVEGGAPPRGPVDTPPKGGDDGGMEARIANLEKFADEARKDLRSIDVRLGKLETVTDGISKNMATKTDAAEIKGSVSQLEATMLKWFIGTAMTFAGLAFAAAKLIS